MSFKEFLKRRNRIHTKILLTFLCLIFLFAIAEIVMSNRRVSRNIEARTMKLLQNHILLLDEVTKEQEEKVAFYAQFMADIMKLSDQLTDTTAGRSALIYLMESLKKDRIEIHLYRQLTHNAKRRGLIQKGLLGIRTTSILEREAGGKPILSIAAVAPIERASGIREVIVAEFPMDSQFLEALRRKTGAEITLIHEGKLYSSTLSPSLQKQAFAGVLNKELYREVFQAGRRVAREISDENDPQKIVFSPLTINFKNQGIYAVSVSLKEVLVNKRTILLQNIAIVVAILGGVAALYYFIVRRLTHPIMELSSASRKVAEGDLGVTIDVKTKDEIGELGEGFNRMVGQLKQSQDRVKGQMDELSKLYKEVSEERNISKSILDNLTNGVILFDPDHSVVLINPTAEQWLGLKEEQVKGMRIIGEPEDPSLEPLYRLGNVVPTEEMIRCWKYFNCDKEKCPAHGNHDLRCWFISGTHCRDEIGGEYPQKMEACKECDIYEAYRSALKGQEDVRVEEVELTKPQRRILKVALCPIFDDHGKFLGLINVFNDITAERQIDRLKTEFVSLVSHELRTPLSSIKAYAEILLKKPDRDTNQRVEFLNIINEETDRLTRLINDILNITKIEERRIDLERNPVDISGVIDKSVSAHRSSGQKKNITIDVGVQRDIPQIWGDEDSLMQVLANLLNNAVKFTPEGGEIRVSAEYLHEDSRSPGEIEVRVRDNGIGIPSEYLEKIFERFYRIDVPFTEGEIGTGLGLYFCKYIVERHGGRIWAESEERRGSTFVFTLPVAEKGEVLHEPLYEAQADDLLLYPKKLREKISILVVDDDKRIRDFLRYYMQEEGFTVYEAEDGSKALELARDIRPSIILLDAVIPGKDGYEVLEALKEDGATENIPVVILSGSEDSKVAMELGATQYLVKPIARENLIKAVNEILGKALGSSNKRRGRKRTA
jgi:signal transduction histidine kinase/CheY-like chemotaxis protein